MELKWSLEVASSHVSLCGVLTLPGCQAEGRVWVESSLWATPPARHGAASTRMREPFPNSCKGSVRASGGPGRVPRIGGILPGTDRAEGVLGSGTCLHKGLGAGPEARRDEEVEAKTVEELDEAFRTNPRNLCLTWGKPEP